jgi:V8-like Glu-specific endopeptidase
LVGGSIDANTANSPWAGVGAITINGSVFSGALLDSTHVLTAAHVVAGQAGTPGNVSFVLNVGGNQTQILSATAITVFPGYTGTAVGTDGVWHDDLAIVTLSTAVTGAVPTYGLYDGSLSGKTLTLVGYGASGDGVNGVTSGSNASVKRVGQNKVDLLLVDDDVVGGSDEVFVFDFDGSTNATNYFGNGNLPSNQTLGATIEAQYAGGDSGSPVFVDDNGVWKIAGIGTFNGDTSLSASNVHFGSIGGGTIVAPYQTWIADTLATPVPEPQTWLMLLVGMGLVGGMVRRHG